MTNSNDNQPHSRTRRAWLGGLALLGTVGWAGPTSAQSTSAGPSQLKSGDGTATKPQQYSYVPPKSGVNYNWGSDHIFIKVASRDTGGAYTLVEDNMKSSFALGLHKHDTHAETFYILDGSLDFYVNDKWITVPAGGTLHIPPGVPHAAMVTPGVESARMTMIFQPGGFDIYLAELAAMPAADRADTAKMKALNVRHDFLELGPVPQRS